MTSSGSLAASVDYRAWGNPETTGGLSAYTPFEFPGAHTDPRGPSYLIGRYYDPATGQFLSVDPDVLQTGEPYSYASADPVNSSDPTGLWTEGYCSAVMVSVIIAAVMQTCIQESNGNQQVGLTVTTSSHALSVLLNLSFWSKFIANPTSSVALRLLNIGGGLGYEISNAPSVIDLGGPFRDHSLSLGALWAGTATYFTGSYGSGNKTHGITGVYLGFGIGLGASYTDARTNTVVRILSGHAAAIIAGIITNLNAGTGSVLRWALRAFISAGG